MTKVNLPETIRQTRRLMGETQQEFANRFGVSITAVSLWESGKREAPYQVISFSLEKTSNYEICPTCKGEGVVKKDGKEETND